jgi:CHAD domain-containing protein
MKLELSLPAGDASRLGRLKLLSRMKSGRWRQRAVSVTWHDTAASALADEGLVLAEQPRAWTLQRRVPDGEPWPPGAPAPVLEQALTLERLTYPLPAGLERIVRFEGRLGLLPLTTENGAVSLELLDGMIVWGRRRRPACRVTLTGDEPAVLTIAAQLAEELAVAVPVASLAVEAYALATGLPIPARHTGAPELRSGLTVAAAFSQAVGHFTDVILFEAQHVLGEDPDIEPVHQMRVAVRRLRSVIAVFRPAIACPMVDAANITLEALADRLAPARDWDVFLAETAATVEKVLPDDEGLRRLRTAADRRRRAAYVDLRTWLDSTSFRSLGIALAGMAGGEAWLAGLDTTQQEVLGLDLTDFAEGALRRRLKRLTENRDDIDHLDAPTLHDIRLRAKRMRYAAEVFAPLYPGKATRRFLRRLSTLQERLGTLNDGAVASALLSDLGADKGGRAHAAGLVRGVLAARAGNARGHIARAWDRFRRLEPFWS